MNNPEAIIRDLGLAKLEIEGGWYCEIFRLPVGRSGRAKGAGIYYLLKGNEFSAFHKLDVDEAYHFFQGDPVCLVTINEKGFQETILGPRMDLGQTRMVLVPEGTWQASYLIQGGNYALMGTTTFPGFEFGGFTLGNPEKLIPHASNHENLIRRLCKGETPDD